MGFGDLPTYRVAGSERVVDEGSFLDFYFYSASVFGTMGCGSVFVLVIVSVTCAFEDCGI